MKSKMWMVRAGENGYLFQDFKNNNLVAVGWDIGDLTKISKLEEIKQLLKKITLIIVKEKCF